MKNVATLATTTILGSLAFILSGAPAQANDDLNPNDLLNLSLEQLSNIEVTSVSKKSEKASEAAAAIYVITQDDIHRSGMTSIPELLRMVPGLSVAQSGSHEWSITSRGTSGQFANKLLVLIDGRSVYTPIFAGVYWDVQDVMLNDIERIEVIRGPGATLWGANAVNGVINIITKSAKDTQGGIVSASAGTVDRSLTDVRYGAKIGENAYARVYAKYDDRNEFKTVTNTGADDAWNKGQSGFRADGQHENLSYTVQGDAYRGGEGFPRTVPTLGAPNFIDDREIVSGANVLGRANYKQSDTSQWTLQTYFDNAERKSLNLYNIKTNTLDFDLQQTWTPSDRHEIVWGTGYRLVSFDSKGSLYLYFNPQHRNDNLFNAFVQDKIALVPNEFYLTLGSKFEHNEYTGFELQPSARLTWLIDSKQTGWASASHAVKTPYRFSSDGSLIISSFPGFAYVSTTPNNQDLSEELNAYELGYRIQPTKNLSFDLSTFYNIYGKLIISSVGAPTLVNVPGFGATPIVPVSPVNGNSGIADGVELAANWEVTNNWKLTGSYTYFNLKLKNADLPGLSVEGMSPRDQFNIRSALNLPHNLELDNAIYYVSEVTGASVPSYVRFDARLAWKPMDNLELSLVGQNLLDNQHLEFPAFVYQNNAQVPRAYYGNITWKF